MEKLMDFLTNTLGRVADRVNGWRYIIVIKNAFYALIPVIIAGAFGTLFGTMVFDTTTGLAQFGPLSFLAMFKPVASTLSYVTLSFLTIYVVFLMGLELGKLNKQEGFFPGIVAVMSYLAVNPSTYQATNDDGLTMLVSDVLAKQYTDTKGLFLGMIIAIASVELYSRLCKCDALNFKMPDTVPPNVSRSFSSLFPGTIAVAFFALIGWAFHEVSGIYLYDLIYNLVQQPLMGVVQGLPGILLLMFVAQVFWVIGIHGNQMIKPIREPLLIAAITANADAFAAGQPLPNVITMPFWDMYMSFGGSGCTLGLLIAILIFSKRDDMKAITKLSLPCGIFNINEPVIFGMPIMLNPLLAIPFIITPLITGTIGYFATVSGFAARAVVYIPWPTPPIFSAWLATAGDFGAVITQIVCIIVSILIYTPFVMLCNRQKVVSYGDDGEPVETANA